MHHVVAAHQQAKKIRTEFTVLQRHDANELALATQQSDSDIHVSFHDANALCRARNAKYLSTKINEEKVMSVWIACDRH